MGLHTPDDGPVAVFLGGAHLLFVGFFRKGGDLPVGLFKLGNLAADSHVVCLGVKSEVGAEYLGIVGLVHLKPAEAAFGGHIDATGTFKVVLPVPLFAGVLFDEGNGVSYLLSGVFLYIVLTVAQGGCQLEAGHAVLQLKALCNNAVAKERAVTGGVALDGAGAQNRRIVVNGNAGFGCGHGAHVTGKAVVLSHVQIVQHSVLVLEYRHIGGNGLTAEALEGGEAHHYGGHLVFVHQYALFGEFHIVADAPVGSEKVSQKLCHVVHNKVKLGVGNAEIFASQALGVAINHHGHC